MAKEKHKFQKGHPNYNTGKKITVAKFEEPWNDFVDRKITQAQAAERMGVTIPTFIKWAREVLLHGAVDETTSFLIWDWDKKETTTKNFPKNEKGGIDYVKNDGDNA